MNINQLSQLSGVPVATIKKYITSKLLAPGKGSGHSKEFEMSHGEDLVLIKLMGDAGHSKKQIKEALDEAHGVPSKKAAKAEKSTKVLRVKVEKSTETPDGEKRKPGRPKKIIDPAAVPAVARKPGRPKKVVDPTATPAEQAAPRKPGRPKKVVDPDQTLVVKKKPGRPPKAAAPAATQFGDAETSMKVTPSSVPSLSKSSGIPTPRSVAQVAEKNSRSYPIAASIHLVFSPLVDAVTPEMELAIVNVMKKAFNDLLG